ncbi:hypothetical protein ABLE91_28175 [Aquabacter sp. CN5-332]|uniref:aspartate racemase/maleate isomerase family protein n=1 Tax=Aquabacter sp. CN5-332 TaxID=3156608 RepID=UPI0032B3DEF2
MTAPRTAPAERAIGVILPSSNRVVERATMSLLLTSPGVDACFARVPYFGNGQGQPENGYDERSFLTAAELLAQAQVQAICWNATRGAAIGFALDIALCERVERHVGIPMVTTALAVLDEFNRRRIRRIALVTHGTPAQGQVFKDRFAEQGVSSTAELHLGYTDNFSAARAPAQPIIDFARDVANRDVADALLIWSTNLPGYRFSSDLELESSLLVIDSATLGIQATLRII